MTDFTQICSETEGIGIYAHCNFPQ